MKGKEMNGKERKGTERKGKKWISTITIIFNINFPVAIKGILYPFYKFQSLQFRWIKL